MMKKTAAMILMLLLAAALTVPAAAANISFGIMTEEEDPYIVEEDGQEEENGRYFDGERYIIYKFMFDEGDTHATLRLPLSSGYSVCVSTDYSEDTGEGNFTELIKQPLPNENASGWWNCYSEPIDLSSYLSACKNRTIYIKVGDYTPSDGFGGYLYRTTVDLEGVCPVTFVSSNGASGDTGTTEPENPNPSTADAGIAVAVVMVAAGAAVVLVKKKHR